MLKPVTTVRCNHVLAQITLGYYDAEGNLVAEETFPQADGGVLSARLYHPYAAELASLINLCIDQAWEKLNAPQPAAGRPGQEEPEEDHRKEVSLGREPLSLA